MFTNFLKPILGLYLCACLAYAAKGKNDNSTTTTTTTTTTAKPFDLSGVETRHFESSVPVLHPGESLSRSHSLSYSRSVQNYEQENPAYRGEISKHRGYSKDQGYNDKAEDGYHYLEREQQAHHPQVVDYFNSHEAQQQYQENDSKNYKEATEQKNNYPYPDHGGKDKTSYGYQESYGQTKDEHYDNGSPLFHYAYEISSNPEQEQHYAVADVPNSAEKPTYGSGESEDYAPKSHQAEYYPKPKPTRYLSENTHKESYGSEDKDNYFPHIPKEAGYVANIQKEPGYLQNTQKETSYPKEAGYSPRNNEPSGFIPMLPKEKTVGSTNDGKVAVYIKHLGHKTPGTNQYVNKERQGFLLLPVLHHKLDEKLKDLSGKSKQEPKPDYQNNKQIIYEESPVVKKQEHVQPKIIHYPVKITSIHHVPAYNLEEEPGKQPAKKVSRSNYRIVRPEIKHTTGENIEYKNAEAYPEDDKSDAGPAPYYPQSAAEYGKQSAEKTYSAGALSYGRPHRIPSAAVKYVPVSLYAKQQEYTPSYDVATRHKPASIKVKDFHPSSFSSLYHAQGYPRIVDLSLAANKKQKSTPISSPIYSTGVSDATSYRNPSFKASSDREKSFLELLQKHEESEIAGFKPSSYTSRGRISAKGLVEGFGLHDYESLLSKPSHGGHLDSLYYDLHSFPAERIYTRFHYPRSGIPKKLIL